MIRFTGLLAALHLFLIVFSDSAAAKNPPTLKDYGSLPDFERASISPNGENTALITKFRGERILFIAAAGKLVLQVPVKNSKVRDLDWANDDLLMVEMSGTIPLGPNFNVRKAELYQTTFISVSKKTTKLLFDKQTGVANANFGSYGTRQVGGKTYGFFGGVPLAKYRDGHFFEGGPAQLYKVDLSNFKAKKVAIQPSFDQRRDWLIDEMGNVAVTLKHSKTSGKWKVENAAGEKIASGVSTDSYPYLLAFGAKDNTIIYKEEDDDGVDRFFEVALTGGQSKEIMGEESIDRFFIHRFTGRLLGYRRDDNARTTVFFDPKQNRNMEKVAKAFPKLNVSLVDMDSEMNKVLAFTNGNKDSGSWWQVDLKTKRADPIGSSYRSIQPENVGEIKVVPYTASDGLEMDGILTLPPGNQAQNLPVVMLPHGGPTSEDRPKFDWWAQALAFRGYAVFQPNFRGSTNRGVEFIRAGDGEWGQKMQTDISDGLAHLAKAGIVDPKRACIVGASYGGYAALAGVTLQQGLYRCAVSVAGVSDLGLMVRTDVSESAGNTKMLRRSLERQLGNGKDRKEVSPRRFAAQADAPILLIHGKDDVVVPYKQSQVMAKALKGAGKMYQLVPLASEDHWLSKGETRLQMLEATVAFLEKHNPAN